MCDRFQLPEVEKYQDDCSVCGVEVRDYEYTHSCDCGKETVCSACCKTCVECGHKGCKGCLYYNKELDEWFCITSGYAETKKGLLASDCMAKYLKVEKVIIETKE